MVALRVSLISFIQMTAAIKVLNSLFCWDDGRLPYIAFLIKLCLINLLSDIGMVHPEFANMTHYVNFVSFILIIFLVSYNYQENIVKVMLGVQLSEIIIFLVCFPIMGLINTLEGRMDTSVYLFPMVGLDIILIIGLICVCWLTLKLGDKWFRRFHHYQIKHLKITSVLVIIYTVLMTVLPMFLADSQFYLIAIIVFFSSSALMLLIMKLMQDEYQRQVKLDGENLRNCLRMLEAQYIAVHDQIGRIEEQRRLITEQMNEMTFWKYEGTERQQEQINTYLQQLRKNFSEIQTGIYCDDWIVDAVLSRKKEEASHQSVDIQISMHQYQLGRIAEVTAAMILYCVMEYGVGLMLMNHEKNVMKLDIGTVNQQMYIYSEINGTGRGWRFKRKLMELVRPYDGIVKITKKKGMTMVTVLIGL